MRRAGLAGLFILFAAPIAAVDSPPLAIEGAIAEALRSNAQLKLLEARLSTAGGQTTVAGAYPFNPEVSYEEALERTVAINQVVEWPGKRTLREAMARRDESAAKAVLRGFRVGLAAQVREAFYELLATRKLVELRKSDLAAGEEILDVSRRRVGGGYAPVTERTSAEAAVVRARRDLREAESRVEQARIALRVLLGREIGPDLAIDGELEPPPADIAFQRLVDATLARHPDLEARRLEVERAGLAFDLARRERIPDITIGPLYSQDSRNSSDDKVGAAVAVPLPIWNRAGPKIALAEAERREAAASLEVTRREVLAELEQAHAALLAARDELGFYTPVLLSELEHELRATRERYAAGELPFLVLREAQRSYFDHVQDYYEALSRAQSAWAALQKSVGASLEELR